MQCQLGDRGLPQTKVLSTPFSQNLRLKCDSVLKILYLFKVKFIYLKSNGITFVIKIIHCYY